MSEPEGGRGELVEDAWVAPNVVVVGVALRLDTQVVQVHVVPADDAGKELVEGDVLVHGRHDLAAFLVQDLVTPVRVHALSNTSKKIHEIRLCLLLCVMLKKCFHEAFF